MAEKPEFTPERQAAFIAWVFDSRPQYLDEYEKALRATIADLEAAIAPAIAKRDQIRQLLGDDSEPLATVTPITAANPKRTRTPRKPKEDKQAPPVQEVVEPVPPVVDNGDDTVTFTSTEVVDETPPEFEPDDFEDFEIPADDANDEF